jgi:hypothetical protein
MLITVLGEAVPVRVGVLSEVILSEVLTPRSELVASVGTVGDCGVVWMLTFKGGELPEVSPAAFSILT